MNDASLEELLSLSFQREAASMYTAIPCIITNIPSSLTDLRVDVQPIINMRYSDGTSEEHTQILGVPVVFPTGRTSMVSFPLFVGDTVLCVFSQSSLDNFKSGAGQIQDASDHRRMDSRDAIAIPGLVPFSKSLNKASARAWPHSTTDMVVAHNIGTGSEVEIRMQPNGNLIINTNQDVTVNAANATVNATESVSVTAGTSIAMSAPSVTLDTPNASWSGTVNHTGSFTSNGIELHTHTHSGVQPGGGNTGAPN